MQNKSPMLQTAMHALEELQAIDIQAIDVHEQTTVTDVMLICSGRASRHVKAIAENVMEIMKEAGWPALSSSGLEQADWALVDFGDIVLHVMQAESRAFYNLEGLWQV